MSGKSLDDYTPAERSAYEQGAADTHARYESMQETARVWLAACIELVGRWEAHANDAADSTPVSVATLQAAENLRAALGLDPSVTITHEHDESCGS